MLTCALLAPASAQTAASSEKQAAIKELVFLVNGDNKAVEIMNVMVAQYQASQDATLKSILDERTDLTDDERKICEDIIVAERKATFKRFEDKLMQKIDLGKMINDIASALYDKYFTLEEIKDLNAFYKSPTGQKTLKTMTSVAGDTVQMVQDELMPKMMLVLKEVADEDRAQIEQKINARKPRPKKKAVKQRSGKA